MGRLTGYHQTWETGKRNKALSTAVLNHAKVILWIFTLENIPLHSGFLIFLSFVLHVLTLILCPHWPVLPLSEPAHIQILSRPWKQLGSSSHPSSLSTSLQQSYVNSSATAQGPMSESDYPKTAPNQMEVWNKSQVISSASRVGIWPLWPILWVRFNASK